MGRPDCSDSGMVYFLLSGNEQATVQDLNQLLHGRRAAADRRSGRPSASKPRIFSSTTTRSPAAGMGAAVSQRMAAQLAAGKTTGSLRTVFNQPYAPSGRYDIEVRYFDATEGRCEFSLFRRRRSARRIVDRVVAFGQLADPDRRQCPGQRRRRNHGEGQGGRQTHRRSRLCAAQQTAERQARTEALAVVVLCSREPRRRPIG